MGLLPHDMEILPPSDDRIFKLLLTSPDSKPVLVDLIRAVIRRDVVNAEVRNNELPPEDVHEKAERLDVNCRLADGTQVDLEMQANAIEEDPGEDEGDEQRHLNLKGKSVYYLCDLHSSQSARYDRLARSYQVTFCSYTVFPQRPGYCNSFSLRHDEDNGLLCDAIHIIFCRTEQASEDIEQICGGYDGPRKMGDIFPVCGFRTQPGEGKRSHSVKGGAEMAGEMLMSISKDERECAVFRSRRMYQTDLMSNLATAEDRGLRRGVEIGKREGRREGTHDAMIIFARRLLAQNHSVEEIMDYTELSREEIEEIRSDSE